MKNKDVVVDSGVLISLTSGCLDPIFNFFAEHHKIRFLIPPSVEYETVTYPFENKIKKFLFSALKIKHLIEDGVIVRIDADIAAKTKLLMNFANNVYFARSKPIQLIERGEAEVMVLSNELEVEYVLVDERTTRLLIESPIKLKEHLELEFGVAMMTNKENLRSLSNLISPLQLIRSSELVMLAYEKGFFDHYEDMKLDALEAALYSMKYAGCSISFKEINDYLTTVK